MTKRKLLRIIDREKVKAAIEKAERRTSGEICVSVSPFFWGNIEKAADRAFARMGMTHTEERNGVLFFVVPSRRKFVVLGDRGIHEKVGQDFWDRIAAILSEKFREKDFTGGLLKGIEEVGMQLSTHFPHESSDRNELSDEVDFSS